MSVTGPAYFNLSSSSVVTLGVTAIGKYSGGVSLEATDSEVTSGTLQNFTAAFTSPVSMFNGRSLAYAVNVTVTVTGASLLGDYYFTFTVRESGLAVSKIVRARLIPP